MSVSVAEGSVYADGKVWHSDARVNLYWTPGLCVSFFSEISSFYWFLYLKFF